MNNQDTIEQLNKALVKAKKSEVAVAADYLNKCEELVTALESIKWALMHLDTNFDIDGNSMSNSDAANALRPVYNKYYANAQDQV